MIEELLSCLGAAMWQAPAAKAKLQATNKEQQLDQQILQLKANLPSTSAAST